MTIPTVMNWIYMYGICHMYIINLAGFYFQVVFLRNHGILACGGTIEEAWHFAFNTMKACETQVKLIPLGNSLNVSLSRISLLLTGNKP